MAYIRLRRHVLCDDLSIIRDWHLQPALRIRMPLMRIRILRITLILFDSDPDPDFHPDADPDPDPGFQIKAQTLEKSAPLGSYSIHFGLSSAN
jgi:hypothetical protein